MKKVRSKLNIFLIFLCQWFLFDYAVSVLPYSKNSAIITKIFFGILNGSRADADWPKILFSDSEFYYSANIFQFSVLESFSEVFTSSQFFCSLTFANMFMVATWTQEVNWVHIKRLEAVQDDFCKASYVCSNYVLFSGRKCLDDHFWKL